MSENKDLTIGQKVFVEFGGDRVSGEILDTHNRPLVKVSYNDVLRKARTFMNMRFNRTMIIPQ